MQYCVSCGTGGLYVIDYMIVSCTLQCCCFTVLQYWLCPGLVSAGIMINMWENDISQNSKWGELKPLEGDPSLPFERVLSSVLIWRGQICSYEHVLNSTAKVMVNVELNSSRFILNF